MTGEDNALSLGEMAAVLGISVPTLRALLARYPDFPVLARGGKGVPWRFDRGAVVEFMAAREADAAAARAEREAQIAAIRLPPELADDPAEGDGWTAAERLKWAQSLQAETDLAIARKLVLPISHLKPVLAEEFGGLRSFVLQLPARIGRDYALPATVIRNMERITASSLRDLVAAARAALGGEGEPDGR